MPFAKDWLELIKRGIVGGANIAPVVQGFEPALQQVPDGEEWAMRCVTNEGAENITYTWTTNTGVPLLDQPGGPVLTGVAVEGTNLQRRCIVENEAGIDDSLSEFGRVEGVAPVANDFNQTDFQPGDFA